MEQYWYCSVSIKGVKNPYSYISDGGRIPPDSYVVVPFGSMNELRVGAVLSCAAYAEEDAPYPVELTKHIVREATAEEYEEQEPVHPYYRYNEVDELLAEARFLIKTKNWEEVLDWAVENDDSYVESLERQAMECYRFCAEQNMPLACLKLGDYYFAGNFVEQNYQRACELYQRAAETGELRAIRGCGYCFSRSPEGDRNKAREYFSLGVMLYDDPACLYELGDLYLTGSGAEKNETYAFLLYQRAMERAEAEEEDLWAAEARLRMGKCLLYGRGTRQDPAEAYARLTQALAVLYQRRRADPQAAEQISSLKRWIQEAESILERDLPPQKDGLRQNTEHEERNG